MEKRKREPTGTQEQTECNIGWENSPIGRNLQRILTQEGHHRPVTSSVEKKEGEGETSRRREENQIEETRKKVEEASMSGRPGRVAR